MVRGRVRVRVSGRVRVKVRGGEGVKERARGAVRGRVKGRAARHLVHRPRLGLRDRCSQRTRGHGLGGGGGRRGRPLRAVSPILKREDAAGTAGGLGGGSGGGGSLLLLLGVPLRHDDATPDQVLDARHVARSRRVVGARSGELISGDGGGEGRELGSIRRGEQRV